MKAIQTDQGFATIVTRLMSRGTSHTYGDWVSTQHSSFNKETINDFIGIDVAKAKCDAINLYSSRSTKNLCERCFGICKDGLG